MHAPVLMTGGLGLYRDVLVAVLVSPVASLLMTVYF